MLALQALPQHKHNMCLLPQDTGVLACILSHLSAPDWGRLLCVSRELQAQVLRALAHTPVIVSIDCAVRSWRAQLQSVAKWCHNIVKLSLHSGSPRSLHNLQLLQPCLHPQLTHLTLQGFKLDAQSCHARHLVSWLLQHCPNLQHLDLQGCELPHLGVLQPLLISSSNQPTSAQQASDSQQQQHVRTGLKVLQLTGARLAQPIAPATTGIGLQQNTAGLASPSSAVSCRATDIAPCPSGLMLQELYLGCGSDDQADAAWLSGSSTVASRDVVRLLLAAGGAESLRVLDVCKRPCIDEDLLLHLAAHPPRQLHALDVSLTRVTARGLLQLLHHCQSVRVLRYACRSGDDGLDAQLMHQLAAALPAVEELDLSLHNHLNDAGLAALSECPQLRKLKLARSHKVTGAGLEKLVPLLPQLRRLEVVRCRGVSQASLKRLAAGGLPHLSVEW